MEIVGLLWNELVIRPMINSLLVLYVVLFNNFGLSILAFTALIRLITLPLTLRQLRQTRAMSLLQPKMKEIQKKHGKDRQKASQETFRLYKEHGVSPLGCLGPLVIQMPILIGLFYALIQTLPMNPDSLADLSQKIYSWLGMAHQAIPIDASFLGTNLGRIVGQEPSIWRFLMPILVGGSTLVQQKMSTVPTTDQRQQSTNTMMLWMFPIMLAVITFQFPSGLALYWFASNIAGIVIQYFVSGWGSLVPARNTMHPDLAPSGPAEEEDKEIVSDGQSGTDSQDDGRGHRTRSKGARRKSRGGRGKHR